MARGLRDLEHGSLQDVTPNWKLELVLRTFCRSSRDAPYTPPMSRAALGYWTTIHKQSEAAVCTTEHKTSTSAEGVYGSTVQLSGLGEHMEVLARHTKSAEASATVRELVSASLLQTLPRIIRCKPKPSDR